MANITINEFNDLPNEHGDLPWPSNKETTVTSGATHVLGDSTRYVVLTADVNCRVSFTGQAAQPSGKTILAAIDNPILLRGGRNCVLRFV